MTRKEIEEQAERATNSFSYRSGYSTPKDAYISAVKWTIAQISDFIERKEKEPAKPHCTFDEGFIYGLKVVTDFIDLDK